MPIPEKTYNTEELFSFDDGVYSDEEDYFETEYPDEIEGERSEGIIVADELDGLDFSNLNGDFKSSLKKLTGHSERKNKEFKKRAKVDVGNSKNRRKTSNKKIVNSLKLKDSWGVNKKATIVSNKRNAISDIYVPDDRKVIINGVNQFILSDSQDIDDAKNIGYYKGKKLKEMVFIVNNDGSNDFNFEFFNPSSPLDYYQATGQNINDRISVSGSNVDGVQFTDVLWNMQSNPTNIHGCRVTITSPSNNIMFEQRQQDFNLIQKDLRACVVIRSVNIGQLLDAYQFQGNIISFNFNKELKRPYIPDGMDVLKYTIKAGCTVSIAFYYEQKMLKKYFYKEARDNKLLM